MKIHIVSVQCYFWVLLGLLVLTVATTEIAKIDLGVFNATAAMSIASAKTLLVALFFMHMRWNSYRTRIVAAGGLLWLGIMVVFVLSDYFSRGWLPTPVGW